MIDVALLVGLKELEEAFCAWWSRAMVRDEFFAEAKLLVRANDDLPFLLVQLLILNAQKLLKRRQDLCLRGLLTVEAQNIAKLEVLGAEALAYQGFENVLAELSKPFQALYL